MTYIVLLLAALVAGVKFFLSSVITKKRADHFRRHGYELKNPKFRTRVKMSGYCGAAGYLVGMLGMYRAATVLFTRLDMMVVVLCMIGAFVVSSVVRYVSFFLLDIGRVDSTSAVEELNRAWMKKPEPLQATEEHGSARLQWAEGTDLADADALRPPQEGGGR